MRGLTHALYALSLTSVVFARPVLAAPGHEVIQNHFLDPQRIEVLNSSQAQVERFTGSKFILDRSVIEDEQALARSVLEATTGTGTAAGTAFYAGNSIVLTNAHVLAYNPASDSTPQCGRFRVSVAGGWPKADCRRVLYCSRTADYCAVEMGNFVDGTTLDERARPAPFRPNPVLEGERLTVIGNPMGMGILATSAKGAHINAQGQLVHYGDTLSGNSGSPIFDSKGRVAGIHFAHNGRPGSNEKYGISATAILRELEERAPEVRARIAIVQDSVNPTYEVGIPSHSAPSAR